MKKFMFAFMALCALLMSFTCTSCHHNDTSELLDNNSYLTTGDSAVVTDLAYMTVFYPEFRDVSDVLQHAEAIKQNMDFEDMMCTLSTQSLATMCDVLTKKKVPLTQRNLLEEYNSKQDVYDSIGEYIPDPSDSIPSEPESQEYIDSGVPITAYKALKKGGRHHE